jgi:O-antigen biosynthesis protein
MTARRRAGAPRLIDWTGERCVPWAPDVQVVYEHLHRYLWAARIVGGGRVLDLGSGEGFGAAILAESAAAVVGIDIDERTVEHSRLNYAGDGGNLEFRVASAADLSEFGDASFDAVVAFEVIEHLDEQDEAMDEVARVLGPDGVLILSTPDRLMYSEATGYENPFHMRELTLEELRQLLLRRFAHAALWSQRTITGSELTAIDLQETATGSSSPFFVERLGDRWIETGSPAPNYLVAVASNRQLPEVASSSTLADCGLELLRKAERDAAGVNAQLEASRAELEAARDAYEIQIAATHVELASVKLRMRDAQGTHDVDLSRMQAAIDAARVQRDGMRTQLLAKGDELAIAYQELAVARQALLRVEESVTWRGFQRVRARVYSALGGERSMRSRGLSAGLRLAGGRSSVAARTGHGAPAQNESPQAQGPSPIELPVFAQPSVSLIIPVHRGADLTRACLESIRDNTTGVSYEVILMDDAADAESKELLAVVRGATNVANDENIGYLRTVNRAASLSRGRWLVLCNNDIAVQPGWLGALLACGESAPDIGVVTPKYVYPDGTLSEAGAIIWSDGRGGNYGRGDDPRRAPYNYRREADYGSAAALLVRADVFASLGGYDERYVPMYYEDADLCFAVRQAGMRVLYEPAAVVTHVEGGTAGTDPHAGHKRHQERNRAKFAEKWADTLRTQHFPYRPDRPRQAADRPSTGHVLVIDHQVPTPDRDAGSVRMVAMIRAIQSLGFQVTFVPDNEAAPQPYTRDLEEQGVEMVCGQQDLHAYLVASLPMFNAVLLSRPGVAPRWLTMVRELAPAATVVYDTVDLHWLREAGAISRLGRGSATAAKVLALRELELAMVRATDATLVATDVERRTLEVEAPGAEVHVVPMLHEVAARVPSLNGRRGVVFVGNGGHPPNADAAVQLVETIMPEVWRALPDVTVTIVGPNPPPELLALRQPLIEVTGWVEDIEPILNASRVLAAPLRFGAGMKGKVTQSLSLGLPVVTTPTGAEGLDSRADNGLLVAEDPAEFAKKIVELYTDDALWCHLSQCGQTMVKQTCSPAVAREVFRRLLSPAQAPRKRIVAPEHSGRS